jgi:TPR repeat protein
MQYANGELVPQDYKEAIKWYRRAAEQGDTMAQVNLGTMYFEGLGVHKNGREAIIDHCIAKGTIHNLSLA